jgi:hypothetical protein
MELAPRVPAAGRRTGHARAFRAQVSADSRPEQIHGLRVEPPYGFGVTLGLALTEGAGV